MGLKNDRMNIKQRINDNLNLILLLSAVGVAMGGGFAGIRAMSEQRAGDIVRVIYAQEAAATNYKIDYLTQRAREQEDAEKKAVCLQSKSTGVCELESKHRKDMWRWEDCTQSGNGPNICGLKPELGL